MNQAFPKALRAWSPAVLAFAFSGCAVGPDFHAPTLPVPDHFHLAKAAGQGASAPAPVPVQALAGANASASADEEFWKSFDDPRLTSLVEQALAANRDLVGAMARLDAADALLGEAGWSRFPTVTASAQGGHERVSQDQSYGFPRSHDTYSAGLHLGWEIDLFGRVRREVEAHRADVLASADDLAALQVAVAAETAATYVQLRGLQEHRRVLLENVDRLRQMQQVVEARLQAGRGTELDSTRAQAQVETTASRLPALDAGIAIAQHRLAVLTGRVPGELGADLDAAAPLPALPAAVDPRTPADLLRRRPDVAAAEARLHAATARIGVATADLFPRVSLSGLLGTQAFHASALFKSGSESDQLLLGVDWSFLDVGRVRARIAASDASAAARLADYQQAVLLALEDAENALVRYDRARDEDQQLERAAHDSERSAELAQVRYRAGRIELFEMLGAERDLLGAQDALAEARTRSAVAAVALYRALAGGWPSRLPEPLRAEAATVRPQAVATSVGP